MLFIKLLLAHFIGDFVLQSQKWIKHKEKHKFASFYLYLHVLIHALLLLILLNFEKKYFLSISIICLTHLVIDGIKLLKPLKNKRLLFFLDQAAHLTILNWASKEWSFGVYLEPYMTEKNLLFLLAIIMLTSVSSIVLKTIFSAWEKDINKISEDHSLANAGRYIGMLERLFVFAFVLLNQWEAIGFLLAAKSVFRFGDLTKASDRKLTEYILIGTLLSFGIAIALGVIFLQWIKITT